MSWGMHDPKKERRLGQLVAITLESPCGAPYPWCSARPGAEAGCRGADGISLEIAPRTWMPSVGVMERLLLHRARCTDRPLATAHGLHGEAPRAQRRSISEAPCQNSRRGIPAGFFGTLGRHSASVCTLPDTLNQAKSFSTEKKRQLRCPCGPHTSREGQPPRSVRPKIDRLIHFLGERTGIAAGRPFAGFQEADRATEAATLRNHDHPGGPRPFRASQTPLALALRGRTSSRAGRIRVCCGPEGGGTSRLSYESR